MTYSNGQNIPANRLSLTATTFIPPLIFALFYPNGFIAALGYAGFIVRLLLSHFAYWLGMANQTTIQRSALSRSRRQFHVGAYLDRRPLNYCHSFPDGIRRSTKSGGLNLTKILTALFVLTEHIKTKGCSHNPFVFLGNLN